jgi:hypothetical protein
MNSTANSQANVADMNCTDAGHKQIVSDLSGQTDVITVIHYLQNKHINFTAYDEGDQVLENALHKSAHVRKIIVSHTVSKSFLIEGVEQLIFQFPANGITKKPYCQKRFIGP